MAEKRPIKFRAWLGTKMQQCDQITMGEKSWNCIDGFGVSIPYQPHIPIMQFTGLIDKNGVEIYEGDICRIWIDEPFFSENMNRSIPDVADYIGEVEYLEGGFFVKGHLLGSLIYDEEFKEEWPEVIGNIYENPKIIPTRRENYENRT